MKLSLVVMTAGKSKGQAVPINLPQFIIGRDPQCNLRPASAVISKRHCAILVKDGNVSVRDFDSTNGTFVNDVPVKGEAALADGNILKIGPLEFQVKIEPSPSGAKVTPLPDKPAVVLPATEEAAVKPQAKTPVMPKPAVKPVPAAAAAQIDAAADTVHANVTAGAGVPKPAAAKETPKPAGAAAEDHSDDESVAAMLLALHGEDGPPAGEEAGDESNVPAGSTVMDLSVTPPNVTPPPGADAAKTTPTKKPDPKNDPAHLAAKAILEKYNRRTRG